MTIEELIELTEGLLGETSVVQLLEGSLAEKTGSMTPEQKGLLVRFVAGERVDPRPVRVTDYAGNVLIDGDPPPPMPDPLPNRTAEGKRMTSTERWERAERTEEQKELVLGVQKGEEAEVDLTGVTLP